MILSPRFVEVLTFAAELHRLQERKVEGQPYLTHLLGATAIVLQYGGDEEQAIAALLHDAIEDQGGLATARVIRERFGAAVAEIVEGCSDACVHPKPPWRQRKEAHLAHLQEASFSVRIVKAADCLDNCRALVQSCRGQGEEIWTHFKGGREGTIWYYRSVVEVLRRGMSHPLLDELARAVELLAELAKGGGQFGA